VARNKISLLLDEKLVRRVLAVLAYRRAIR
jgi:hypothetical protein